MAKTRAMVFEVPDHPRVDPRHPFTADAQAENLRAAFAYYQSKKTFRSGDLCRECRGLATFIDDPVLLFVRMLDPTNEADNEIVADVLRNQRCNRIDCIVLRVHDTGACSFYPYDSNILEPLVLDGGT